MAGRSPSPSQQESAEAIGLAALVFLTEDGERLGRFLGETGLSPADLGSAAGTPHMLAAVLEYLLADESLLMVFAAGAGLDPLDIAPARFTLGGGGSGMNEEGYGETANRQSRTAVKKPSRRWRGPEPDAG